MEKIRVAINGFGRIGRNFLKSAEESEGLEVVAINDLGELDNLVYLLKHDSVHGRWNHQVEAEKEKNLLLIDGREVSFSQEKDPTQLPWEKLKIDVVVESTGVFTSYAAMKMHLDAGAKRVVLSAPAKDEGEEEIGRTILMGLNEQELDKYSLTSNGSCTTNSVALLVYILERELGIEKALLTTIHGYTATQGVVDGPNKRDWRRGRAAAVNLVPTTTGAATTVTKVVKSLGGLFDGIAIRVPVVDGSVSDLTFLSKKETSKEEVVSILKEAAKEERWKKIIKVSEEPLVSTDIVGEKYPSIIDASMARVLDKKLVKVLAWYDNEDGYTQSLLMHVEKAGELIKENG